MIRNLIFALAAALLLVATPAEAAQAPAANANLGHATSAPSNPTGTTSTSPFKMMGLAGSFTPGSTGRALLIITGDVTNTTAADGAILQMAYGTGAAPSNAGAAAGTLVGSAVHYTASPTTTSKAPFALVAFVSGLTVGTAYWLDVQVEAVTGGTATIANVVIVALEP